MVIGDLGVVIMVAVKHAEGVERKDTEVVMIRNHLTADFLVLVAKFNIRYAIKIFVQVIQGIFIDT